MMVAKKTIAPPPVSVAAAPVVATKKQIAAKTKSRKVQKSRQNLIDELWPEIDLDTLWNRQSCDGYNSIPRTMPHIMAIIDSLSKNTPASATYFALWCRAWDESYLRIQSPDALAAESGFSGERKVTTWKGRMRILADLGFINPKSGDNEFEYILIMNPHRVIRELNQSKRVPEQLYRTLFARAQDVGAKDLTGSI